MYIRALRMCARILKYNTTKRNYYSRRISFFPWIMVLFVLCLSFPVRAEVWKQYNVISKHYFSIAATGGYYSLLENIPEVTTRGGGAGMLGIGYEFRYNGFWLTTGVEVQYGTSTMNMDGYDVHREMYDTQGKRVSYHYYVAGYSDTQRDFRVGVPLMLGFYTNGIYGGIGAKFSYVPHSVTTPSITYTTTGTYERYIADFENMPNHFYTEYTTPGHNELKMHPQGLIIAELGYDILNKERMQNYALCSVLKIGLYAEYGINSAFSGNEHDELTYGVNPINPSQLTVDSYYVRNSLQGARIVPFFVGVKVAFMLRIRTSNCRCVGPI